MKKVILTLAALLLGLVGISSAGAASAETVVSVTQTNYDYLNHPICTALRMNSAAYGTLPDACSLSTTDVNIGPDRITQNTYDAAGQLVQTRQGYATSLVRVYASFAYSNNGSVTDTVDARGNRSHNTYDGFDRLTAAYYPSPTPPGSSFDSSTAAQAVATSGGYNNTDKDQYTYDNNGNKTSWTRRDGSVFNFTYDNLNRETVKDVPGGTTADVYTNYDGLGRVTWRRFSSTSGSGNAYSYDGLGRLSSTTDINGRSVGYQYNQASARTQLTYASGLYVTYVLDNLNRVNKATLSNGRLLYSLAYTNMGQMRKVNRVHNNLATEDPTTCTTNTDATCYGYDAFGRLASMSNDFNNTDHDITWTFTGYNAAGQLTGSSASIATFDYKDTSSASDDLISFDGLNRDAGQVAPTGACTSANYPSGGYDARGNLVCDSRVFRTYVFDVENRLTGANNNAVGFTYDPDGRLSTYTVSGTTTSFLYDGSNLIAEYNSSGAVTKQYYFGPGADQPLVSFDGTTYGLFWTDYHGSIIATTADGGTLIDSNLYKYTPYGEPKTSTNGDGWTGANTRFRYTGQIALPELKLYYYKARVYDPAYGHFLQTDPIGSGDDFDLYAYVKDDPINGSDPTGMQAATDDQKHEDFCRQNPEKCDAKDDPNKQVWAFLANARQALTDYGNESIDALCHGDCSLNNLVSAYSDVLAQTPNCLSDPSCSSAFDLPPILRAESKGAEVVGAFCCFVANTKIATKQGLRSIEDIKVGDLVLSRDSSSGVSAFKPVINIIPAHNRLIYSVTFILTDRGGASHTDTFSTTSNHPWRTADGKWTETNRLKVGQAVQTAYGPTAIVEAIVNTKRIKPTYNLEIADFHTYFVGKDRIWVHNCGLPSFTKAITGSNLPHAISRAVERAGFASEEEARAAIVGITNYMHTNLSFPAGAILDTKPNSVLVPIGHGGYLVYRIAKNGTAAVRTVLGAW